MYGKLYKFVNVIFCINGNIRSPVLWLWVISMVAANKILTRVVVRRGSASIYYQHHTEPLADTGADRPLPQGCRWTRHSAETALHSGQ